MVLNWLRTNRGTETRRGFKGLWGANGFVMKSNGRERGAIRSSIVESPTGNVKGKCGYIRSILVRVCDFHVPLDGYSRAVAENAELPHTLAENDV
jgi:hypothetical protein